MRQFRVFLWTAVLLVLSVIRPIIDYIGEAQTMSALPVVKWLLNPAFSFALFAGAVILGAWAYFDIRIRKDPVGFAANANNKKVYRRQAIVGAAIVILLFVGCPLIYGHYHHALSSAMPVAKVVEPIQPSAQAPQISPAAPRKIKMVKRPRKKSATQAQSNKGANDTNTQIGAAQAPVAIAPNGIANAAPNLGTQTVNNTFSNTYPRPGTMPEVHFCISKSEPVGDHYETVMTIETNTDISAPFWGLFFDGPVTEATITIPGIKEPFGSSNGHPFPQGASLSPLETLPVKSRLLLTANAGPTTVSPDNILRIQITEIGPPFGGPFRPWGVGDRINVTIRSRQSIRLLAITSGYGREFLEETMMAQCD